MRKGLCFGILLVLSNITAVQADGLKQVAAPPEEVQQGHLRLPDPAAAALHSRSLMLPVVLSAQGASWQQDVPVDQTGKVSFTLIAPTQGQWDLQVQAPNQALWSQRHSPSRAGVIRHRGEVGFGAQRFPAEAVSFERPVSGQWHVRVTGQPAAGGRDVQAYLAVSSDSPYRLRSQLTHYHLLRGHSIGLQAQVYDAASGGEQALRDSVQEASLILHGPDGQVSTQLLYDDGAHDDQLADDGIYGVSFIGDDTGEYLAEIRVRALSPAGESFERSSVHVVPVIAPNLRLSRRAQVRSQAQGWRIELDAMVADPQLSLRVAGELWGTDAQGKAQPITWLSAMVTPQTSGAAYVLPLNLDARWLNNSTAGAPYSLRAVRVQDAQTNIPMDEVASMALDLPPQPVLRSSAVVGITEDMLMGKRPVQTTLSSNTLTTAAVGGRVMLTHGYCASRTPWPQADFSNYAVFSDLNQNRSHDAFAQRLLSAGSAYPSFGVIAHSQGGAAALHLYTYYWSGLDNASGARLIQTVGTPFRGTALAGSLALIGDVFGAGCGTNWDMSYDGAALWLAGIPNWARDRVYYATTSPTDKWYRYDYCSLATDLFLDDPDDGVTERWAGQLSGGHNMGHKTGWCHTVSMRDPAQYQDHTRNRDMNANASR